MLTVFAPGLPNHNRFEVNKLGCTVSLHQKLPTVMAVVNGIEGVEDANRKTDSCDSFLMDHTKEFFGFLIGPNIPFSTARCVFTSKLGTGISRRMLLAEAASFASSMLGMKTAGQ